MPSWSDLGGALFTPGLSMVGNMRSGRAPWDSGPQQGQSSTQTSTPASSTTTPSATTPSAAPTQPGSNMTNAYSPLAMNAYLGQVIGPMMQNAVTGLQGQNAMLTQMAMNNPMAKYMPASMQAYFSQAIPQQAQMQNDVTTALQGAALAQPGLTNLTNQMNNIMSAAQQDYEKQIYNANTGGTVDPAVMAAIFKGAQSSQPNG